jgi:capsid protein
MSKQKKVKQADKQKIKANGLYDSSRSYNRKLRTYVAYTQYNEDHDTNVTEWDLNLIRSRARDLFANTPAIRNAIAEIASYSVGDAWMLKSKTSDKQYNKQVENYINLNMIPLMNLHQALRILVKSVLRDGDVLMVLTASADGSYPTFQFIPAHKIAGNGLVESGPYKGYEIVKGTIIDNFGKPIAYKIVNRNKPDQIVSVFNCQLASENDDFTQLRGESALKNCINTWEDINTVLAFELQGIKTASSKALIINAPSNQVDSLAEEDLENPLVSSVPETNSLGNSVGVKQSELRGGEVIVFDNSQGGGEMKQVDTNRPTQNVQDFLTNLVRHAMLSLRWPMEFSVNLDMGGATAKTIGHKIDNRISEVQQTIILPIWNRMMKYAIAKAAKSGYIPYHEEWYKFEPTYPRSYSYDQFRDTKSNLELYKLGILTATQLAAAEGYDYQDTLEGKYNELKAAHALTDGQNVGFAELIQLTPNLNSAVIPEATPQPNNISQ